MLFKMKYLGGKTNITLTLLPSIPPQYLPQIKFTYSTHSTAIQNSSLGTYTISFTTYHFKPQFLHFTSSHTLLHPNITQQHHSSNSSTTSISTQQFKLSRVQLMQFTSTQSPLDPNIRQQHHSFNSPQTYMYTDGKKLSILDIF